MKLQKCIRFILAIIVSPIYLPLFATSLILIAATNYLSDFPDWEIYKQYYHAGLKWYLFK